MDEKDIEGQFAKIISSCSDMLHPLEQEHIRQFLLKNVRNPRAANAIYAACEKAKNLSEFAKESIHKEVPAPPVRETAWATDACRG